MAGSSGRALPQFPRAGLVAIPLVCVALSGGTAALILTGYSLHGGIVALVCAAMLVIARRGRQLVHRMDGARDRRFHFGSRVSSSIFDASVLLPLAWTERIAFPRVSVVALVGLGTSYLVSYQLARGQALGYAGWESAVYRITTAALLVVSLLGGSFHEALLEVPLWVFTALTGAAALRRASDVRAQDRHEVESRTTA